MDYPIMIYYETCLGDQKTAINDLQNLTSYRLNITSGGSEFVQASVFTTK